MTDTCVYCASPAWPQNNITIRTEAGSRAYSQQGHRLSVACKASFDVIMKTTIATMSSQENKYKLLIDDESGTEVVVLRLGSVRRRQRRQARTWRVINHSVTCTRVSQYNKWNCGHDDNLRLCFAYWYCLGFVAIITADQWHRMQLPITKCETFQFYVGKSSPTRSRERHVKQWTLQYRPQHV